MEPTIDYAEVGLIAGLEVHQQLLTEKKMFCHCPAGLYTREHDGVVLRHMRPTLSELGEYDGTALMEFKTRKNIIYLLHKSNVCTYEMDDTPPFLVNQKALDVAIEQCLMLGCDIVDEVHIARKQYLDGSIPTGFQRTAMVGVNGRLPLRGRELSITQVTVEEDSCREVSDQGHLIVWRTDRLGMPLIETVTGPDLRTPDEVEEAILLIGRVCRSTGHVRVGMGASRQDVNVSVRGGRRVEIKGVPRASWAPALVHGEAVRQVNLLKLRDELHAQGFKTEQDLDFTHEEVTDIFCSSQLTTLRQDAWSEFLEADKRRDGFEQGKGPFCVRAVRLPRLAWTLTWPTQPDFAFDHELAGRVRVIACLDQQPILLHSEKWPDYIDSRQELRKVRNQLGCTLEDGVVVIWGAEEDTITAAEEIRLRFVAATDGVPNETRQPYEDGSTDFERILPGPDRMYPDTDSPPIAVTRDRVEGLEATLGPPPWEREARYGKVGVPTPVIYFLIRRGDAALVDLAVEKAEVDLRRACFFFGETVKGLRRDGVEVDALDVRAWVALLSLVHRNPVLWEVMPRLVWLVSRNPERSPVELALEKGLGAAPDGWREAAAELVTTSKPDHAAALPGALQRFHMGQVMPALRGRVPAREIAALVSTILSAAEEAR